MTALILQAVVVLIGIKRQLRPMSGQSVLHYGAGVVHYGRLFSSITLGGFAALPLAAFVHYGWWNWCSECKAVTDNKFLPHCFYLLVPHCFIDVAWDTLLILNLDWLTMNLS